ncbi:MAG TPA: YggS family pyridoxal phosphate-dependent enzyme [Terriglobales bacterium]|nr:YggS family pyridoxal phosphate-dependent enzyme [Terriglobales bacterium]
MSGSVAANVAAILAALPPGVELVAAAKTRTAAEILEAVEAGVRIVGENYVQEAESAIAAVGPKARWHFIGHLQTNKARKAVALFDLIETVDSVGLAREIDKRAAALGRTMPILIEVNSGREPQKAGVLPEDAEALVREIAVLPNVRVSGLMTMGPFEGDPEASRPYFKETRRVWEALRAAAVPAVEMRRLSMGMTNSWRIAVEEGATLVRIGTAIFGPRS